MVVDDKIILRGASALKTNQLVESSVAPSKVVSGFGDEAGLKGVLTDGGELLLLARLEGENGTGEKVLHLRHVSIEAVEEERRRFHGEPLHHLAIAGNGKVCASFGTVSFSRSIFHRRKLFI